MEGIMLQTEWDWQIALYLFLGGLAGGTYLVSGVISLKEKGAALQRTVRFASWAALVCLAVGLLCLLTEVRMPIRAMMVWQSFSNFGSWMAIGAWLLVAGGVAGLLYALANTDAIANKAAFLKKIRKPMAIIVAILGTCIAAYTGILLSVLVAHPLWNTPLLPILFTVSAVDTGVALCVGFAAVREPEGEKKSAWMHLLEMCTVVLVAVEAVVLVLMFALVSSGSDVGGLSVALLTSGSLAVPFWVLFVVVGLVAPFAVALMSVRSAKAVASKGAQANAQGDSDGKPPVKESKAGRSRWVTLAGAICCLAGGCALRFLVLMAGLPLWA